MAQVGIAGSVEFQDNVVVGGQAGFAGHLKVGKGAKIAAQSGITKDVKPGAYLKGNPAMPVQLFNRIAVLQKNFQIYSKGLPKSRTKSNPLIMDRTSSIKIFSGTSNLSLPKKFAPILGIPLGDALVTAFPDNESFVDLMKTSEEQMFFCYSLPPRLPIIM